MSSEARGGWTFLICVKRDFYANRFSKSERRVAWREAAATRGGGDRSKAIGSSVGDTTW